MSQSAFRRLLCHRRGQFVPLDPGDPRPFLADRSPYAVASVRGRVARRANFRRRRSAASRHFRCAACRGLHGGPESRQRDCRPDRWHVLAAVGTNPTSSCCAVDHAGRAHRARGPVRRAAVVGGAAASSVNLYGPDAAHYHVPYAVNIAAGDSLFGLPATPHLYPMAGSVIAAWFIVPLGDPLLVDLAMVMPFALLVASINYLVRTMTGVSGIGLGDVVHAWRCSATPLFRSRQRGSGRLVVRGRLRRGVVDCRGICGARPLAQRGHRAARLCVWSAGGIKDDRGRGGGPADGWGGHCQCSASRARRLESDLVRPLSSGRSPWQAASRFGAGGIWLLRNWIQFGSPLAPAGLQLFGLTVFEGETHQGTTYFSVLGEMQTSGFDIRTRGAHYIREWLGPVFLPSLALVCVSVVDLGLTLQTPHLRHAVVGPSGVSHSRAGIGATLVWMLIGAPWTALERSRGLTLRYALPVAALLPVLAFTATSPVAMALVRVAVGNVARVTRLPGGGGPLVLLAKRGGSRCIATARSGLAGRQCAVAVLTAAAWRPKATCQGSSQRRSRDSRSALLDLTASSPRIGASGIGPPPVFARRRPHSQAASCLAASGVPCIWLSAATSVHAAFHASASRFFSVVTG